MRAEYSPRRGSVIPNRGSIFLQRGPEFPHARLTCKATSKIMEYRQRLFTYNARRQFSAQYHRSCRLSWPKPHVTFHLNGWKQNLKALRSKCCKILKRKSTSISKNTSIRFFHRSHNTVHFGGICIKTMDNQFTEA